jgi:hypothetical protein
MRIARMKWVISVAAGFLLVGCVLGWCYLENEIFSRQTLARLTPGLCTNEVIAILGPPAKIWVHGEWIYVRPLKRQVGIVYFDSSGRLREAIND